MTTKLNQFFFTLPCLVLALLTGCTGPQSQSHVRAGDAAFQQLTEEYLSGYFAWRPLDAVQLGLHEYDGKLTDYRRASLDAELARLQACDRRLAGVDPAALSAPARFDFRVLRAANQRALFKFQEMNSFTANPITYARALDVSPYIKRNFAPLEQRVRSITATLNEAPNVLAAARANLAASLPKPLVELAILMGDGSADFLEKDLMTALQDLRDPAARADFEKANQRAVKKLRAYVKYLQEEKMPRATAQFALGRDNFAKMLREGELVSLPPERILEIGMAELRQEQQLFAEAAARIDPTRKPIDVFKEIQRDHPTAASLIPDAQRDLEQLRSFVTRRHLVGLPSEVRPQVQATLPFDRAGSFASMDSPGAFETKATEAYYYVTPTEPEWTPQQKEEWLTAFNYYTLDVVSIHEVYPGHYTQFVSMNASPASRVAKTMDSYAFVEGWAHYTEQMLIDEGFGATAAGGQTAEIRAAKYRMAQLDEALLRLCRLCVAIRMHCQGMTVAEGARFFQDNCYYEEKPAHSEAMRGTFDPGYLNYTLGKLMILKLRRDYQKQEGAKFSLEKFHNEMLRHGMPPIPLLREVLLKDPQSWGDVL